MKKRLLVGAVAALATLSPTALAADHADGPQATSNFMLDITDLFTWTDATATKLNLVMDVTPNASKTSSLFSDMGQYVFNISSYPAYGVPLGAKAVDQSQVICTFAGMTAPQTVCCWLVVGTPGPNGTIMNPKTVDYVTGSASATTGLVSQNGDFTVFTGPRQDPFFFNLAGFNQTIATVEQAASASPGLTFNSAGCPMLDTATSMLLVNELMTSDMQGDPAVDHFAGFDVISIVVQVKTSAVTSAGHTVVGVWAGTYM
jgi:hypothetical protein